MQHGIRRHAARRARTLRRAGGRGDRSRRPHRDVDDPQRPHRRDRHGRHHRFAGLPGHARGQRAPHRLRRGGSPLRGVRRGGGHRLARGARGRGGVPGAAPPRRRRHARPRLHPLPVPRGCHQLRDGARGEPRLERQRDREGRVPPARVRRPAGRARRGPHSPLRGDGSVGRRIRPPGASPDGPRDPRCAAGADRRHRPAALRRGIHSVLRRTHDPQRRPDRRPAAPRDDRAGLVGARRGLGAHHVRRNEGAVHRVVHERCAALAHGQGQGLGHGRVRDAPARDEQPQRPREHQGQGRRSHARDLAPDRPRAPRRRRHEGARREHDRHRLRRAAGRRRDAHRRDHGRVRRPRRCHRVGPREEVHRAAFRGAGGLGVGRVGRHHRRHPDAGPRLRRGRARRDRHERRGHWPRPVRRGAGHGRGRAVRQARARPAARARRQRLRAAARPADCGAGGLTWRASSWPPTIRTRSRSSRRSSPRPVPTSRSSGTTDPSRSRTV